MPQLANCELSFLEQVLAAFPGAVLLPDEADQEPGGGECLNLWADGQQETTSPAVPSTKRRAGVVAAPASLSSSWPDTPVCITGCQSAEQPQTAPEVELPCVQEAPQSGGILVDWVSYTMGCEPAQVLAVVARQKGLLGSDWHDMEKPFHGYGAGCQCGNIIILWHGHSENMGVHVQISGAGCRELEARGLTDWRGWFRDRFNDGARFRRVDHAFDDRDGLLDIDRMVADFKAGLLVSRFAKIQPVEDWTQDAEGQLTRTSHALNLGQRTQDTSVCIYDKALEQRQKLLKNKTIDADAYAEKMKQLEGHWIRLELRSKDARAEVLVGAIIRQGFTAVASVLRSYMEFKLRNPANSQRTRWGMSDWWFEFIGWAEKVRLTLSPVVKTLEQAMSWLDHQAGAVLGMVKEVLPDFQEWLLGVAERGVNRHGVRHKTMMQAYLSGAAATPAHRRVSAEDGRTAAPLSRGVLA